MQKKTIPPLSLMALNSLAALWCLLVLNTSLWQSLLEWRPVGTWGDVLYLTSFIALVFTVLFVFLTPFTLSQKVAKPILGILIIASSAAAYYVNHYGILIDKTMIRNVLATNSAETLELMTPRLMSYVLLWGVLPATVIQLVNVKTQTVQKVLWQRAMALLGLLVMVGVIAALSYSSHAALLRNHREVRHMLTPVNMLAGAGSLVAENFQNPLPYEPIAAGVALGTHWKGQTPVSKTGAGVLKKPVVMVLIIGETARAQNFGLNGYLRQTTPKLAAIDELLVFKNVTACGTSTAISVPCIFSDLPRDEFSLRKARSRDNLLRVLEEAGFTIKWFDNNTSCNGVCAGREEMRADRERQGNYCHEELPCVDEAVFEMMWRELGQAKVNTVLVLHMLGSHGPGYHLRYPLEFEKFVPACHETDFSKCSTQEIINAYDNSILYTDHLLAQTVTKAQFHHNDYDSVVWYVSDHGESLGEKGLYLHAIPYAVAPKEQLQVPMVLWMSDGFRQRMDLDVACLNQSTERALSHDHIFHSALGLLDVQLPVKRPSLDMFSGCVKQAS